MDFSFKFSTHPSGWTDSRIDIQVGGLTVSLSDS